MKAKSHLLTKLCVALPLLSIFLLSACDIPGVNQPVKVTGVSLSDETISLRMDETENLTATIYPANATNQNLIWETSNSAIVTVEDGVLTPVSIGYTSVQVKTEDGEFTDNCIVTIKASIVHVSMVTIDETLSLEIGDSTDLSVTISPSNAENKNVSWSIDNSNIASIDQDGHVTANAIGAATITATSEDGGLTDTCALTVTAVQPLSNITISSSTSMGISGFATNFDIIKLGGISYSYYRAAKTSSTSKGILLLYSYKDYIYDYQNMEGAFYNNDPIKGIKKITVNYIAENGLNITYGPTYVREKSTTLPATDSTWKEYTANLDGNNGYFSIETNGCDLYINSIVIGYTNTYTPDTSVTENTDYRLAPVQFSGTLVDGVSSVTMPVKSTLSADGYTITENKTYTYYSYDYCSSHSSVLANAAMTDPIDVSNYYIAFGMIPANYGGSISVGDCASLSQAKSLFGDNARQISWYDRTTGYARSVPYNTASYYEFDIDVDGTYSSTRGTGRVVMWITGWSCYGSAPVATFTDDHYTTFTEYLNTGTFGTRFDAQPTSYGYRSGYANALGSTLGQKI